MILLRLFRRSAATGSNQLGQCPTSMFGDNGVLVIAKLLKN